MSAAETESPRALRRGPALRAATAFFLALWAVFAAFPLVWTALTSLRLPVDALSPNAWDVIAGPATAARVGGASPLTLIAVAAAVAAAGLLWRRSRPGATAAALAGAVVAALTLAEPAGVGAGAAAPPWLLRPILGVTVQHYAAVWFGDALWRNFLNTLLVTVGVVSISLSVGALAGYGLSRMRGDVAFWLLVAALMLRALPHSVLVAGYMPIFMESRSLLAPIFGEAAPTLYGQPAAAILVLVAINQPFTIWMLQSFFRSVPTDLDEAAMVDGCTRFGAFRRVIAPLMWPGVATAGLFSFLLAYNDYLVCALLLDGASQTMTPAITGFFNRETTSADQMEAIAAAVSVTAPLFALVAVFQRRLVEGLTAGAVKG